LKDFAEQGLDSESRCRVVCDCDLGKETVLKTDIFFKYNGRVKWAIWRRMRSIFCRNYGLVV